jgi:hypothetical protein
VNASHSNVPSPKLHLLEVGNGEGFEYKSTYPMALLDWTKLIFEKMNERNVSRHLSTAVSRQYKICVVMEIY